MERELISLKPWSFQVLTERTKDLIIALSFAFVGILGSYLILGRTVLNSSEENTVSSKSFKKDATLHGISNTTNTTNSTFKSSNVLLVQGDLHVNDIVRIINLQFQTDQKYLIDFGNGIRQVMMAESITMRYLDPGIYILRCYIWSDKKWKLIDAQTLTIQTKSGQHLYQS